MKFKWDKKYLYWGVTAFCVIACSVLFFSAINHWQRFKSILANLEYILSPIIIGFVIAYILRPGLNFLERNALLPLGKRLFKSNAKKAASFSRGIALLIMILAMLAAIFGVFMLVLPQLYQSIEKLVTNMDSYIAVVKGWTDAHLAERPEFETAMQNYVSRGLQYFADWLQTGVMNKIDTIIVSVTSGLKSFIMALVHFAVGVIVSIYVLYSKEKFGAQTKKIIYSIFKPHTANGVLEAARKTDEMFSGFFIGKLVDSAIIGIICAIFTGIAGIPYFLLVSVIIGITNIIPFFGPYIGTVPCAFFILLESPVQCLIFVIFIIILQTFDGNILGPKILGNKTNLTSFWVVTSILVGGGLFGFIGMVCGVPVCAVIYYFCQRRVRSRLKEKNMPLDTETYELLVSVDEETNELRLNEKRANQQGRRRKTIK